MPDKHHERLVFLLDVDNTLLDNDRSKEDMKKALREVLGERGTEHFWALYEEVRKELDVVSYPETLERFAGTWEDKKVAEKAAELINNWPYRDYVYPNTFEALEHLTKMGEVAILSDGDSDYQPRKIANAGLAEAVGGPKDVLVYTHKETCFEDVMKRLPGRHYVVVEDKRKLLSEAEKFMGWRVTTVWVKQGHYATDPKQMTKPEPDIVLEKIGDLLALGEEDFRAAGSRE